MKNVPNGLVVLIKDMYVINFARINGLHTLATTACRCKNHRRKIHIIVSNNTQQQMEHNKEHRKNT
jgi:hypothetical protein